MREFIFAGKHKTTPISRVPNRSVFPKFLSGEQGPIQRILRPSQVYASTSVAAAPQPLFGKGKAAKQTASTKSTIPGRHVRQNREVNSMLYLQRTIGNQAVRRMLQTSGDHMVELPRESVKHPALAQLERSDVRFRVTTFADLKAVYTSPTLKIPEAVVKQRVAQLLGRMQREKRLKSTQPVSTIINKIFPAPGVIDEAEFKAAIDVADRTAIYQSVLDANTKVKTGDKPRLRALMADAASEIQTARGNATGLTQVFGTKAAAAKGHYAKARDSLNEVSTGMDSKVSTDYNLDDSEVFLGGWAHHGSRHMHLLINVVKGVDPNEAKATLIHEAAHLAHPSIDDLGYYGTSNFEAMTEDKKVANAAHYEEIPRRQLGISSFDGLTFTPGVLSSGGAVTWKDEIKKAASDFMQQAWDAAVDTHTGIRAVRKAALAGNRSVFTSHRATILEISKLMDLTIHEQDPAAAEVTMLDVTLTESIARGVGIVGQLVNKEKVTYMNLPWSSPAAKDEAHRNLLIEIGIAKYGQLLTRSTQDRKRAMKLLNWLVVHFRSVPLP